MAKQTKKTVTKKPELKKAIKRVAKATPKKVVPAKKAPAKKAAVKPVRVAKPVATKAADKPVQKTVLGRKEATKVLASRVIAKNRFSKDDLKAFQRELLTTRDRITSQSGAMKSAALQRTDEVNLEEEGTDAFMRLQTLEQVGTQQGTVIKINEALDAISKGTYGVCDSCNELITKARLNVLPFARTCIKCQAEMEQASRHGRRR
ncbi:MAG: TraR/DksA family transcriptional regulator [bacterium]